MTFSDGNWQRPKRTNARCCMPAHPLAPLRRSLPMLLLFHRWQNGKMLMFLIRVQPYVTRGTMFGFQGNR